MSLPGRYASEARDALRAALVNAETVVQACDASDLDTARRAAHAAAREADTAARLARAAAALLGPLNEPRAVRHG